MKNSFKFVASTSLIALLLASCGSKNTIADKTLVVGASPTPHALILEAARPAIEAAGYQLKIVEFTDYVLPNLSLQDGELDANYFQHLPYLEDFNVNNDTDLVSALAVHFEPLGIYAGKKTSLAQVASGDRIAIPNDNTNGGRALLLLAQEGLLTAKEGTAAKGIAVTLDDFDNSLYQLDIYRTNAEAVPAALGDVAFGVINGNYALSAQVTDSILAQESTESAAALTYANIIAVKAGNENAEAITVLKAALTTETVRSYIQDTFGGVVVPVFA
jgi:D-methionine transport system substrate-binding protein